MSEHACRAVRRQDLPLLGMNRIGRIQHFPKIFVIMKNFLLLLLKFIISCGFFQFRTLTILQIFISLRPKLVSINYSTIHFLSCTLDITLTLGVEIRHVIFVLEHLSLLS